MKFIDIGDNIKVCSDPDADGEYEMNIKFADFDYNEQTLAVWLTREEVDNLISVWAQNV